MALCGTVDPFFSSLAGQNDLARTPLLWVRNWMEKYGRKSGQDGQENIWVLSKNAVNRNKNPLKTIIPGVILHVLAEMTMVLHGFGLYPRFRLRVLDPICDPLCP